MKTAFCLVARHRREIKQLLDSARDRNRVGNTSITAEPAGTPLRPMTRSRAATTEDDQNKLKQSPTLKKVEPKKPSLCSCMGKSLKSFWKTRRNIFKQLFKLLCIALLFGAGTYFLVQNKDKLMPRPRGKFSWKFLLFNNSSVIFSSNILFH